MYIQILLSWHGFPGLVLVAANFNTQELVGSPGFPRLGNVKKIMFEKDARWCPSLLIKLVNITLISLGLSW